MSTATLSKPETIESLENKIENAKLNLNNPKIAGDPAKLKAINELIAKYEKQIHDIQNPPEEAEAEQTAPEADGTTVAEPIVDKKTTMKKAKKVKAVKPAKVKVAKPVKAVKEKTTRAPKAAAPTKKEIQELKHDPKVAKILELDSPKHAMHYRLHKHKLSNTQISMLTDSPIASVARNIWYYTSEAKSL